ncbi:hypothetical protein BDZ89DRAFT_1043657 [Hymenopellis radicata]|nr:hypothetical protein BDZ89DRAFT_1043657 [Hymenopellis radicata]
MVDELSPFSNTIDSFPPELLGEIFKHIKLRWLKNIALHLVLMQQAVQSCPEIVDYIRRLSLSDYRQRFKTTDAAAVDSYIATVVPLLRKVNFVLVNAGGELLDNNFLPLWVFASLCLHAPVTSIDIRNYRGFSITDVFHPLSNRPITRIRFSALSSAVMDPGVVLPNAAGGLVPHLQVQNLTVRDGIIDLAPWLEQLIDGGHLHPLENFVCIDDFTEPATIAAVNRVTTSAPHRRITLVWAFMSTMQPVFNVPRYNTLQELPCIGFDIVAPSSNTFTDKPEWSFVRFDNIVHFCDRTASLLNTFNPSWMQFERSRYLLNPHAINFIESPLNHPSTFYEHHTMAAEVMHFPPELVDQLCQTCSFKELWTLSLVSRTWTHMAQSYIYEDISLRSVSDIVRLTSLLSSFPHLGLLIKRVTVRSSWQARDPTTKAVIESFIHNASRFLSSIHTITLEAGTANLCDGSPFLLISILEALALQSRDLHLLDLRMFTTISMTDLFTSNLPSLITHQLSLWVLDNQGAGHFKRTSELVCVDDFLMEDAILALNAVTATLPIDTLALVWDFETFRDEPFDHAKDTAPRLQPNIGFNNIRLDIQISCFLEHSRRQVKRLHDSLDCMLAVLPIWTKMFDNRSAYPHVLHIPFPLSRTALTSVLINAFNGLDRKLATTHTLHSVRLFPLNPRIRYGQVSWGLCTTNIEKAFPLLIEKGVLEIMFSSVHVAQSLLQTTIIPSVDIVNCVNLPWCAYNLVSIHQLNQLARTESMDSMSPEFISLVMQEDLSNEDLASCALTCKAWARIGQGHLYHSIRLHTVQDVVCLGRVFQDHPHIATLIRRIDLCFIRPLDPNGVERDIDKFVAYETCMKNVEELTVDCQDLEHYGGVIIIPLLRSIVHGSQKPLAVYLEELCNCNDIPPLLSALDHYSVIKVEFRTLLERSPRNYIRLNQEWTPFSGSFHFLDWILEVQEEEDVAIEEMNSVQCIAFGNCVSCFARWIDEIYHNGGLSKLARIVCTDDLWNAQVVINMNRLLSFLPLTHLTLDWNLDHIALYPNHHGDASKFELIDISHIHNVSLLFTLRGPADVNEALPHYLACLLPLWMRMLSGTNHSSMTSLRIMYPFGYGEMPSTVLSHYLALDGMLAKKADLLVTIESFPIYPHCINEAVLSQHFPELYIHKRIVAV